MRNHKAIPTSLLVAVAFVSLSFDSCKSGSENASTITILYDNDAHCNIDGYSRIAGIGDSLRAAGNNVLTVSAGDFISGGLAGLLSEGEWPVRMLNAAGYDLVTLGNHEFDYGMEQLFNLSETLKPDIVCCNLIDRRSGRPCYPPYMIKECNGTKIAFIGITTPSTFTESNPTNFIDGDGNIVYDFCQDSLEAILQTAVNNARMEGAAFTVLLSHLGVDNSNAISSRDIAAAISGLDVIIDGHSHTEIPCETIKGKDGHNVILTQSGYAFNNIGKVVLSENGVSAGLIPVKSVSLCNDSVRKLADTITAMTGQCGGAVIATSAYPLDYDIEQEVQQIRVRECSLGNLIADAFRMYYDSDIAFCIGGSIRSALPEGDITYNDILTILPFNDELITLDVPGHTVADALELSVSQLPKPFGGFIQVSGIRFNVDSSIPSGVELDDAGMFTRVSGTRRVSDIEVFDRRSRTYKPLDPEHTYKVTSVTYIMRECGNGYTMFLDCEPSAKVKDPMEYSELLSVFLSSPDYLGGVLPDAYRTAGNRIAIR